MNDYKIKYISRVIVGALILIGGHCFEKLGILTYSEFLLSVLVMWGAALDE